VEWRDLLFIFLSCGQTHCQGWFGPWFGPTPRGQGAIMDSSQHFIVIRWTFRRWPNNLTSLQANWYAKAVTILSLHPVSLTSLTQTGQGSYTDTSPVGVYERPPYTPPHTNHSPLQRQSSLVQVAKLHSWPLSHNVSWLAMKLKY